MTCSGQFFTQQKGFLAKRSSEDYNSINPFGGLLFSSNWKWNNPALTSVKHKSNNTHSSPSLKHDIILWFQKLSSKEKLACTSIYNAAFIQKLIKMLPHRAKNRIFNLIEEKYIQTLPFAEEDTFFDLLLKEMRICWLGEAVLYFVSSQLMDIRMLNWLNSVSNNKIFEYAQRGREEEYNLLWFNKASYHNLQNWLANEFETSIVKNYFNKQISNYYVSQFKNYFINTCKNSEKEYVEMTFQATLEKSQQELCVIKGRLKEYEDRYGEKRQIQLIQSMEQIEQKKRNKRRQKKKKLDKINDKTRCQQEQDNKAREQIAYTKERQANKVSPVSLVNDKENKIETNITISKNEPNHHMNVQKIKASSSQYKSPEKHNQIPIEKNQHNQPQTKPFQSTTSQTKKNTKNLIYISPKRTRSPDNVPSSKSIFQNYQVKEKYSQEDKESIKIVQESSQNNYSFEEKSTEHGQGMNKKKRRRCKKENEQFVEVRKNIWKKMIARELNQLVDQLSTETNALYNLKIISFERVRVFIQSLYPAANTILFGSNAIGLSLPNSDVDILLYGLPCDYREEASDILAQIAVQINAMGWVVSCSTYLGAKVPLIKLEIDPSISFLQTKRKQDLFRVYNPLALYHLDTQNCPMGQTIKVDITINIEGITSIGYQSTVLMKNWLEKIPDIRSVLILFKYILSIRNFNSNFNGGIGSYCLFSMIAAFMKEHNQQGSIQLNFINLLKWYGQQFDNLTHVVWLREQGECFVRQHTTDLIVQDNKKSLLKLMDPISNKMMNSSCNEYNNIRAEFRRILTQITQLQNKIDQQMKDNGSTLVELTKMMQTKKGVDKWITKFQSKYGNSIRYIISRLS